MVTQSFQKTVIDDELANEAMNFELWTHSSFKVETI
jgi:hypothetical protein